MVLSNKKLKQKLREDLVKSLSVSVAESNTETLTSLQSQSLRELLDSASHKPRLTKREKRRNSDTCVRDEDEEAIDGIGDKEVENGVISEKSGREKKKRKREETVKVEIGEEEEGEKTQKKSKKKKKKKKRKKSKKTVKKDDEEKVKEEEEIKVDTEIKKEVEEEEEEEEKDGIVPKKVYVGGIPYQSTEDEIRSYFKSCGVTTKVDCMMHPEDGSFTGIAFITFESEEGAKRALGFDRAAMGDRFLTIQQYVKTTPSVPRVRTSSGFAPQMVDGYNRIYIGNLAWDTTDHDIRKLFSDCVIHSIRLGKNKETGDFKGYAHVDFKDSVSVSMALKLDQHIICGRPVKICCALKERPAGEISINPTRDETNNVDSYKMDETYAAAPALPIEGNYGNYFTPTVSTGKVKRRSCYECGEKGHLSTACPKKIQNAVDQANTTLNQETLNTGPAMPSYDLPSNNGGYYRNDTYAATNEANTGSIAPTVSSGKIKRRACYECGEKGHLSTDCPKNIQNAVGQANTTLNQETLNTRTAMRSYDLPSNNGGYYMNDTYAATNEANTGSIAPTVSSGKIKRRACYECGEKGHLSTDCPKKIQNTTHQTVAAERVQLTSYNPEKKAGDTQYNSGHYMDETCATHPVSVAATNGASEGIIAPVVSSRKIKGRNCYECGGKGHLSSACPKKHQK